MADDTREKSEVVVDTALGGMKLEEGRDETIVVNGTYEGAKTHQLKKSRSSTPASKDSASQSPNIQSFQDTSISDQDEQEELMGGDISVTVEAGKGRKLSRKSIQKVAARPAPLFTDLEDVKDEAVQVFQLIPTCMYGSKYMGDSHTDPLDCDCSAEWSEFPPQPSVAIY